MRLLLIILLLSITSSDVLGQVKRRRKPSRPASANEQFLQTQFWIGFKGGVNLSRANPEQNFFNFCSPRFPGS